MTVLPFTSMFSFFMGIAGSVERFAKTEAASTLCEKRRYTGFKKRPAERSTSVSFNRNGKSVW